MIIAFFPCTRFENQIYMWFQGTNAAEKNWSDCRKLEYNLKLHKELNDNYSLITKMTILCIKKGLRLIIENPHSSEHYLTRYWCIKPKVIDSDRRKRGDYYKKPTQYWFIDCEPENNFVMEMQNINAVDFGIINLPPHSAERSLLHPQYANRFIREFILGEEFEQQEEQIMMI